MAMLRFGNPEGQLAFANRAPAGHRRAQKARNPLKIIVFRKGAWLHPLAEQGRRSPAAALPDAAAVRRGTPLTGPGRQNGVSRMG